jgi:two-component system chemotaxis response regulator CheB
MQENIEISEKAIVIGASSGGLKAITAILSALPEDHKIPILIAQHLSPRSDNFWIQNLNNITKYKVKEADEKEPVVEGMVYIAPPNYHLLVEYDKTLSLSADQKVNFSRPSIDVLFESAADVYGENLIGILLTGSSRDGATGIVKIKDKGGITIAQDPLEAESPPMPVAAIATSKVDHVLALLDIIELLIKFNWGNS